MDKTRDIQVLSHNIQITDRKSLQMNGVKKIENFNKGRRTRINKIRYIRWKYLHKR